MTRILVINPNATEAMTHAIQASAQAALPGGTVEAWTSHDGPAAIEGAQDGARAIPPLLRLIKSARDIDGIIIACFDDTGLAEAKALSPVPVIGIGEASFHMARLLGHRFSVVTTLPVSVPVIEGNIQATGFADVCGRVRASNVPVLELERDPKAAFHAIRAEAEQALAQDGVSAIVLGCAGMTGLAESLADLPAQIIDGVPAAVHLAFASASLRRAG
ncbi:MAG: aspartate/glutamate racemase family protein [Pseudomonadota bacterium]